MEIDGKIAQANGRLRAANVGVIIEIRSDRLVLRATLPPKPGSHQSKPFQQRISLGIRANPAGLKKAEAEARKIGALIDCREFDWTPYLKPVHNYQTCGELIAAIKENFWATPTTWDGDYWKIYRLLPADKPLTAELVEKTISSLTPENPNSKTRRRAVTALNKLCELAGLDYSPRPLAGNYSPAVVEPRDLPTDREIIEAWERLTNPKWQWFLGMMATYGLRPHEVFRIKDYEWPIIHVNQNTKTGERLVWPFYPEWVNEFDLQVIKMPSINLERTNEAIGGQCTHYFWRKIPFNLYSLRHRWAIRTLEFGMDLSLAAQQMGHSVAVHSRIYHRWIGKDVHQRAYQALMSNPNRPLPPKSKADKT